MNMSDYLFKTSNNSEISIVLGTRSIFWKSWFLNVKLIMKQLTFSVQSSFDNIRFCKATHENNEI